jgi:3-isopropylmalate dehydrogenase
MTDDDPSAKAGKGKKVKLASRISVALLPGDGIGPEVTAEVERVAAALREAGGPIVRFQRFDWNADRFLATGEALPAGGIDGLRRFDAIFAGAYGDPRVPDHGHARAVLLGMRRELDLFVNVRPVRCLGERLNPLRNTPSRAIDMVFVRENTEGLYAGIGGVVHVGSGLEVAVEEMVATRQGTERILRAAFELARSRPQRRLTLVDKSNALHHVGGLWQRTFHEVRQSYPDVDAGHLYVDAAAMFLLTDPGRFDVIVTENLLGDILTDLASPLQGGLGMAPSANLNPAGVSLFEPVHGSAPDLVGTGRANPIGAVLSFGLLLRHLGHGAAAERVERAVSAVIEEGGGTPDLGGGDSTWEVGERIRRRLLQGVAA